VFVLIIYRVEYINQKLKRADYVKASDMTSRIQADLIMVEAVPDYIKEQKQELCDSDLSDSNSLPPTPHSRKLRPLIPGTEELAKCGDSG